MGTLNEFKKYIKNKYPKTKKMFNGKRCDNNISIEALLLEIEDFEKMR